MRSVERLSARQARRIALAAQGFGDQRPAGRVDLRHARKVLGHIGLLQIDSVNVLVRSHELPLFSRLGPYPRSIVTDLTERKHELFEYWAHVASFIPVELQPALRWRMERASGEAWTHVAAMEHKRPGYVDAIEAEVAERGPIAASELTDPGVKQGPWWGWGDGKSALEWLFWSGRLVSAGRGNNFERIYDLPERVLPAWVLAAPTPSLEEQQRTLLMVSARALGIGTARDVADYFRIKVPEARPRLAELVEAGSLIPTKVEGWPQTAYLHPEAQLPRWVRARALLSPFDSLIWERERTERVFGMRVRLEVYTPAPKRVHGYYVLPFLLGDALVARVDLKRDTKASALRVLAAHAEPGVDHMLVAEELAVELRAMARWLGLDRVEAADRGDLAPALRRALEGAG
ncbi:MAG: uncharacterized protein QOJ67_2725 [Acidimicrobiaceae bacterium]